ncbi:hypothetical protein L7F22_044784 [Adiantum nelumboides]|nr:hypothetical protein [Adiantum nelumboides]
MSRSDEIVGEEDEWWLDDFFVDDSYVLKSFTYGSETITLYCLQTSSKSMETPVHLSETMQSPKPSPNAQEQVAETPIFQAVRVQPATSQQPITGSNEQGSNLQAMQQVFPPPSVHPGYFGGGSVFRIMAGRALANQFYTPRTVFGGAQMMMPNPMYGSVGMQPGFLSTQGQFGMPQTNFADYDLTGQVVWPGAELFNKYIAQGLLSLSDLSILELGSGVGLAGLFCGRYCRKIVMTDHNNKVLEVR